MKCIKISGWILSWEVLGLRCVTVVFALSLLFPQCGDAHRATRFKRRLRQGLRNISRSSFYFIRSWHRILFSSLLPIIFVCTTNLSLEMLFHELHGLPSAQVLSLTLEISFPCHSVKLRRWDSIQMTSVELPPILSWSSSSFHSDFTALHHWITKVYARFNLPSLLWPSI